MTQRETNRAEFRAKKEAERAQERINAPVGKTAGDIRAAWILSRDRDNPARDAEQLPDALAARGLVMARVDAADIYQNGAGRRLCQGDRQPRADFARGRAGRRQ